MIIDQTILARLEKIRADFDFRQDISLYETTLKTMRFVFERRRDIQNFPRRCEVKEQLQEFVVNARTLQETIKSTMPLIQHEYNRIYECMQRKVTNNTKHLRIEDFNRALKVFRDLGVHICPEGVRNTNDMIAASKNMRAIINTSIDNFQNSLTKGKVDIYVKINTILRIKNMHIQAITLTEYLQEALANLITASEIIINNIKLDGRPSHPLTRNTIFWLAHLYETLGTKERAPQANCREDESSVKNRPPAKYYGEFYELFLRCRVFFRLMGVHLPWKPSTLGDLAKGTIREYKILTGKTNLKTYEDKKFLETDHLTSLMNIPDEIYALLENK